jgi:ABC-2 type transport system ATP-binding protein
MMSTDAVGLSVTYASSTNTSSTNAAPPRLVVDGLVRRYRDFQLGPLTFDVNAGRVCGLLGANGAGKTTLLACLAGQASLHQGSVAWRGRPIVRGDWRYREAVTYVRDVPALYDELTVSQMMAFAGRVYRTWNPETADQLLERFALDPRKPVKALSRGMKVKLALLLGVSHDVSLLLLDEVTAGLDPGARDDVQEFLRRVAAERGVCVMLSSHLFEDIERAADEVMILRGGQIVFRGPCLGEAARPHSPDQVETPAATLRDLYFTHSGNAR